ATHGASSWWRCNAQPDSNMRDFDAHVRRHLLRRDVAEDQYDDVVEQLASELEARYTALINRGSTDEEAWSAVLTQVPSWPALARDLSEARNRSHPPARAPHLRALFAAERWLRDFALGLRVLRKDRWFS